MPEALSKKEWSAHRFDEMAVIVNDRIDNPREADEQYYVGLEHLDSDSLTIRRWGSPLDVEATKLRFKKGDIIFGRRRVYQRKLAVADFDGICSAHAMVLRAKPKVALPAFLPFFMQSDIFMDRAREISVGSLSPTINWKTLAQEEFALPPIEEQLRIADLLISATAAAESLRKAAHAAGEVYLAVGADRLARPGISGVDPREWMQPGWACGRLGDLVVPSAPICYGIVQVGSHEPQGIPTLAIKDLRGDFGDGVHRTSPAIESRYVRSRVQAGDLLLSIKASIGEVGIVPEGFEGNISRDLARLRFNQLKLNARFFLHLYRSPRYTQYVNSRVVGSTRAELSIATLKQMLVPIPSPGEQSRLVEELDSLLSAQQALNDRATIAAKLSRHILYSVLWHEGSSG